MKFNVSKHNVGDEVQGVKFVPGEGDGDVHPERWESTGLLKVDKVRMTADAEGQKETVLSSHQVDRHIHEFKTTTKSGNKKIVKTPIERVIDIPEQELEMEHTFVTLDDAREMLGKKNVYMVYVVKIKGCENIIYTREFSKVAMLLETFWAGKDDISQKIIIERVEKTLDEWINLDITPIDIVIQYARGEIKEITEDMRTRDMEQFIFEEDDDVAELDESLDMMRDIERFTQERAEKARGEMLEEDEKLDILKDLSLFTKSSAEDGSIEPGPQKENPLANSRLRTDGGNRSKPIKKVGRR